MATVVVNTGGGAVAFFFFAGKVVVEAILGVNELLVYDLVI